MLLNFSFINKNIPFVFHKRFRVNTIQMDHLPFMNYSLEIGLFQPLVAYYILWLPKLVNTSNHLIYNRLRGTMLYKVYFPSNNILLKFIYFLQNLSQQAVFLLKRLRLKLGESWDYQRFARANSIKAHLHSFDNLKIKFEII